MQEKRLTIVSLSKYLDVAANTITGWKTRNDIPPSQYILSISEYLGVSLDYLFTGDEAGGNLDESTKELVDVYSKLDLQSKSIVLAKAIEELRRLEDR